jgi:hypothetical protein
MQSATTRLLSIQQMFAVRQRLEQSINFSINDWLIKSLNFHLNFPRADRVGYKSMRSIPSVVSSGLRLEPEIKGC